jgi:predicted permease
MKRNTLFGMVLEGLIQDLRFAIRVLAKNALFTTAIILTLAAGMGANTAIFSIVNAVLLRPLPYQDPDRLVVIWGTLNQRPNEKVFASYGDYQELRTHSRSFEDVAATTWAFAGQTLIWHGEPYRVLAIPSTENLFSLLGIQPILGGTFTKSDPASGCTVVLAHGFWQNRLGGSPEVVNGNLTLDGQSCTVAGVMGDDFEFFPKLTEVWTLIKPNSKLAAQPTNSVAIFARLKPGVTRTQAQAEAEQLHQEVVHAAPAGSWVRDVVPHVYDLQDEFMFLAGPNLRLAVLALFAAVVMVLLIACVNIAGLLISRGAERQKEFAVRAALGGGRSRIVRQLLVESMLLAIAGAGVGVAIATFAVRYFRAVTPIDLPPGNPVEVSWHVLAFTALVAITTGVLSGVIPALKVSRISLNEVLKGAGASIAPNWLSSKSGKCLIIAEVALSVILLIGAGLLIESIHRLTAVPLSFRADHLMTASLNLPVGDYTEAERRVRFFNSLLSHLAALPGIEGVALSSNRPLSGQNNSAATVAGRTEPTSEVGDVGAEQVTQDFMRVIGIPLLRGRQFNSGDHENSAQVAIVNQKFAEEFFPNEDPLGRQIKFGLPNSQNPWLTIVGIVGNVERADFFKEMGYRVPPIVYRPISQRLAESAWLLIRTRNDSKDVASLIRREVNVLDTRVPVDDFTTVDQLISKNLSQPRFRTVLLGFFAGIALLLATVGLYGVLMQAVVQRTREIGIRMALGAKHGHVLRMVIRQGLTLTILGILAGLLSSVYLTRFLSSMLFGVTATDPPTFATTSAILIGVTLLASYMPARRATKVDPVVALKHE